MRWLKEFPTVNAKAAAAILLAILVVLTALGLEIVGRSMTLAVLEALLWFVASLFGIGTVGLIGKRITTKPSVIEAEARAEVSRATGTYPAMQRTESETVTKTVTEAPKPTKPEVD